MFNKILGDRVTRIITGYLAISLVYIYLSDQIVENYLGAILPASKLLLIHTFKGWAFVFATAAYFLISLRNAHFETEAEQAARKKSEDRLEILLENVPGFAYRCLEDDVWTMLFLSDGIYDLLGYQAESLVGREAQIFDELIAPEDRRHVHRTIQTQGSAFHTYNLTYRMLHKDGRVRWVWERGQVVGVNDAGINILEGYVVDISERVELSDQMNHLNQRLNALFENAPVGIVFMSEDEILDINQAALAMLNMPKREVLGRSPRVMLTGDNRSLYAQILKKVEEDGACYMAVELERHAADPIWVELNIIADIQPQVHIALINDVSQRLTYEFQLQNQVQRFSALNRISATISASRDVRQTYNGILAEATQALKADAGVILDYDPTDMRLYYASGAQLNVEPTAASVSLGESLAGRALIEREPVFISDLNSSELHPDLREWINKEGFISYAALPLHATGEFIGVLELYHRERFVPDKEWIEFAETLANDCAIGMQAVKTRVALQTANQQLLLAYETTLTGWAKALEYRDKETEGHSDRVTQVTVELAQRLNASEDDLTHIRWGARLHDIGKMAIPDRILLKEGPLDEDEWVKMRQHPQLAYDWLREIPFLKQALDIPHYHHEKWDGSGYPEGLSGNAIPIPARIFAVVDVWDALSHDRPYRKAWTKDQVRAYLQNQSGTHFDPEIVPEFLAWLDENEH